MFIVAACVVTGALAGALTALVDPLFVLPLIPLAAAGVWGLRSPERALWLLVAAIALLPRIASPVSIGFKPTVVDAGLALFLLAWLVDRARGSRHGASAGLSPVVAVPLVGLVFVAVATFIVGVPNGALTTLVLRRFAELILTLLATFWMTKVLADATARQLVVRAFLIAGALAGLIGLVLYVTNALTAERVLSALRPFGYPYGNGVVRYVRDDPSLLRRATGLWIDPNAYGGFLLVTASVCLPQLFTRKPVLPRGIVALCVGVMGAALVATISRGAMLGLAAVGIGIAVLRYRRLLPLLLVAVAAALILPQTRELIAHFADGFALRDAASQMRLGEYKDAFRLIERYPIFGVGFADTPDVDLYIGVSNMYLLIAQQMGLMGLAFFAAVIVGFFIRAGQAARVALARHPSAALPDVTVDIWIGACGGVCGALLSGIFDHYFFNIDFHNAVMLFWIVLALAMATSHTILSHDAAKS